MEALFVLALTKSHRTSKDRELIGFEQSSAHISAEIDRKYGPLRLELSLSQQGKKAKSTDSARKLSDFIGSLNVVMFAPRIWRLSKARRGSPPVS